MNNRGSDASRQQLRQSANNWGYRAQLDGLRAVAVYLVVAFHAGSWKLQGGFVGVDLFFVLSGFLVTNVILADLADEGRLRLRRFYARRVRRLIPAAAIAVVGTSLAAALISNQLDRSSWSSDATASSLWWANWHFISEANSYFLSDDATSPFQHFWSLSIEEQFYLAFPAVLTLLWILLRRNIVAIAAAVSALLIVGVGLQLYWAERDPNRAYLGTDTRAYQLLVGVLLALIIWRWPIPRWLQQSASWFAMASLAVFLLVSSQWFDVSASIRGFAAAVAAGLCVVSIQTAKAGPVVGFLSWTPIRYLGQISYGTYLWHWPVVVLTLQLVDISPTALLIVSAGLGTALAALSHELVERHVRRTEWLNPRPSAAIVSGVAIAVVSGLLIAPALLESERKPSIIPISSPAAAPTGTNVQPVPTDIDWEAFTAVSREPPCERADATDCILSTGSSGTMLLIGDSFARMFIPTFQFIAQQRDLELAAAISTSCPWMESALPNETVGQKRCTDVRQLLYDYQLDILDPDIIVLIGYPYSLWPPGLTSTNPDLADIPMPEILETLVTNSITTLTADARRLVFIEPTPIFDTNPLTCLSGAAAAASCTFPPKISEIEENLYRDAANRSDLAITIDLDPIACPRLPICDPLQRGYPLWMDKTHFTVKFAKQLGPLVDNELAQNGTFDRMNGAD